MKWWKSLSVNAALAGCLAAAAPALAAPLTRVEARVDVAGSGAMGAHLRRAIPRHLAQELSSNPIDAPPGARLVVRVTDIALSSDIGGDPDGGLAMMDALDGEALLLDARGAVLARKRVTGRMPPTFGAPIFGAMGMPNEPRRIEALAESIAYWTARAFR